MVWFRCGGRRFACGMLLKVLGIRCDLIDTTVGGPLLELSLCMWLEKRAVAVALLCWRSAGEAGEAD